MKAILVPRNEKFVAAANFFIQPPRRSRELRHEISLPI